MYIEMFELRFVAYKIETGVLIEEKNRFLLFLFVNKLLNVWTFAIPAQNVNAF